MVINSQRRSNSIFNPLIEIIRKMLIITNGQAATDKIPSKEKKRKMTSAATAAGGGTGWRGGSDRQREENN